MKKLDAVQLIKSWRASTKKFVTDAFLDPSDPSKPAQLTGQQEQAADVFDALVKAKIKAFNRQQGKDVTLSAEEEILSQKIGVSIMSGHGTGKDTFASLVILKFLLCFTFPKILCTATSAHQLKDVLWSEIAKWLNQSKPDEQNQPFLKSWITWQSEKIFLSEHKGERWFAVGRTANPKSTIDEQSETLAGIHEDYMLYVIDEASGIPEPVFKPLEGTLTGKCNIVLMIFNPTRSKGFAIDSQFKDRSRWVTLRWNSEESERVSQSQVEYMARKYGKDSNAYRIRVLGLPPRTDEKVLIQWDWVMDAVNREVEPLDTDREFFIIDVGAGGDESVLTRRHGPKILEIKTNNTPESEVLTNWIMRQAFDYEPSMILIDPIGVGWGIAGNLRARLPQMLIVDVNVADAAPDDMRFQKLRDELWWRLRDEFEQGIISIPDDPILIGELTAVQIVDDSESRGKIKIESKRDMKKRGVESPNRGDTLAMSEYFGIEMMRRMKTATRGSWRKRLNPSWRTI